MGGKFLDKLVHGVPFRADVFSRTTSYGFLERLYFGCGFAALCSFVSFVVNLLLFAVSAFALFASFAVNFLGSLCSSVASVVRAHSVLIDRVSQ
jgi:hypothetical protein